MSTTQISRGVYISPALCDFFETGYVGKGLNEEPRVVIRFFDSSEFIFRVSKDQDPYVVLNKIIARIEAGTLSSKNVDWERQADLARNNDRFSQTLDYVALINE